MGKQKNLHFRRQKLVLCYHTKRKGDSHWQTVSSCGLLSTRGPWAHWRVHWGITSMNLLALQPAAPLPKGCTAGSSSTRTHQDPRPFSAELLTSPAAPSMFGARGSTGLCTAQYLLLRDSFWLGKTTSIHPALLLKLPSCPHREGTETFFHSEIQRLLSVTAYLFHAFHFRDVELQHVLDPVLQGDDGTGTAGTWTLQFQLHNPILEAFINDITTIFLHCRPDGTQHSV